MRHRGGMNGFTADLRGRTAVVTGASSGIGEAVARRLAADGASVALLARRRERVEAVAAECGGLAVVADVADHAALTRAAEEVRDRLGRVDTVVANAGFLRTDPALAGAAEEAAEMVTANVTGASWAVRTFAEDLLAAGAGGGPADAVFVSSLGAAAGMPLLSLYGATKAAVSYLARTTRAEFAPSGVRVHDIEPAWTTTALADSYADALGELTGAPVQAPAPPLSPDDVAAVVAFCVGAPPLVNIAHVALTPTWLG